MNLTYSYQATAGQMGAGSTAGNAGQLMSLSGTIGGTTDSANYTYDNYGRLVTSNHASNGSSAQRRFAYDRWANRTGVWDATSGGTQIQSITLQQAGGVATNRITSVTNISTTLNYSYDASGNATNDGVHSYTYDSENRLVSVDGTAAQYGYDHQNRRYKKIVGSTVTHYIWQGGKVLGEYNGSTGAALASYWYAGERLFKKTGATTQLFLGDRLSVRLTLSDIGAVVGRQAHLPFGEDFAENGTQQKQHFTSYERDSESGTDYATNRQYSQSIGRFNRPDPYSASCTLSKPQSLNRYSYGKNDPIGSTDPSGLDDFAPNPGTGGYPWGWWEGWGGYNDSYDYSTGLWNLDVPISNPLIPVGFPSVGDFLQRLFEFLTGGTLWVSPRCGVDSVGYVRGSPEKNGSAPWRLAPLDRKLDADFAVTERGLVKIPNGCDCRVTCGDGDDYKFKCVCTLTNKLKKKWEPRLLPANYWDSGGEEVVKPPYEWIFRRTPYQKGFAYETPEEGGPPVLPAYTFF